MPETLKNNFKLSYNGDINYDNIGELLGELKDKMDHFGFKLGTYKKVLAVMVECLENIYKYLDHSKISSDTRKEFPSTFLLEYTENCFVMKAGNPLLTSDISNLEERLSGINQLDNEALREKYKKIITDGKFTDKGGAGLGFIEMVKTTGNRIGFLFEKRTETLSYFNITLTIPVKIQS